MKIYHPLGRFLVILALTCFVLGFLFWLYDSLWISALIVFVLAPWVDSMALKIPRFLVASFLVGGMLAFLLLISIVWLPSLYKELLELAALVPSALVRIHEEWLPSIREKILELGWMNSERFDQVVSHLSISLANPNWPYALMSLWQKAPILMGSLVEIILVPITTFFLFKDLPKIMILWKSLIPKDLMPLYVLWSQRFHSVFFIVIRGQVTIATILGSLYCLGLWTLDVKGFFVIGVVSGICRLVPYLDVLVGLPLSFLSTLASNGTSKDLLEIAGLFFLVQVTDGMFITPRIMGSRLGLHPLVVVLSVMTCSTFWGLWGGLVAMPLVACMKTFLELLWPHYAQSSFYLGKKEE